MSGDLKYFEDEPVGEKQILGAITFSEAAILRFARQFDPSPLHTDPAIKGPYGGLTASPFHVGSSWLGLLIRNQEQERRAVGPSPGIVNQQWHAPVFAGDTITYHSEVIEGRLLKSKPEWGLARTQNHGFNQHGDLVWSVIGQVLIQRRP